MSSRALALILSFVFIEAAPAAQSCDKLLAINPALNARYVPDRSSKNQIMSDEMKASWNALSPEQQLGLVRKFQVFWQVNYEVDRNRDEVFGRFVEFTQWTLIAAFEFWPRSYSVNWLKSYMLELQNQSSTTQEVKEELDLVLGLLRP